MKILIVSATFSEIRYLYEQTQLISKHDDYLSSHRYNDNDIDILITGVGMTTTAYQLGLAASKTNYDVAFNFGIAGSFDREINIGEVVNVVEDVVSELGGENAGLFMKFDDLIIDKKSVEKTIWQVKNYRIYLNAVTGILRRVKGITVNTVHGNDESIKKVIQLFHPDVETMEGAAFLYFCRDRKIKSAQIRCISNYVESRNTALWNIKLAIENLNKTAIEILNTL